MPNAMPNAMPSPAEQSCCCDDPKCGCSCGCDAGPCCGNCKSCVCCDD